MPAVDFIEVYEDALPADACAALLQRFEASGQAQRGATGSGVDLTMKDSWDIQLDQAPGWADVRQQLNDTVLRCLRDYLRRYAHVALAPLQLKMQAPGSKELVLLDAEGMARLDDALLNGLIAKVFRPGSINLQKYIAGQGGYPYWHCEQYPKRDQGEALHRALLWTIYLNDDFAAGETEFLYQQRKIQPRTGSLLIAPAGFTHTHRGNRPEGGNKFIATSWILYQRAEALFA
ncbi:2OG-Fe(II) oxygenase [Paucibacter sp. APW11]|uniref:2OG-Fe(II) oxygenase n=1 Tax=Roseateles aquae TaxID=3077235 RepID=A0ABU3PEA4_9BURK|nr:2OG-Fe(II) oxygenase [Paucibacter sp. APW11]MDT9000911.1 2OG-Fe(II) oxygenase [Paucibacter sp. APW11]